MITAEQLRRLPPGHVVHRFEGPEGRKMKMKVYRTMVYKVCDICKKDTGKFAVKTEGGGNITLMTQCFECAADELNEERK